MIGLRFTLLLVVASLLPCARVAGVLSPEQITLPAQAGFIGVMSCAVVYHRAGFTVFPGAVLFSPITRSVTLLASPQSAVGVPSSPRQPGVSFRFKAFGGYKTPCSVGERASVGLKTFFRPSLWSIKSQLEASLG